MPWKSMSEAGVADAGAGTSPLPPPEAFVDADVRVLQAWVRADPEAALALNVDTATFPGVCLTLRRLMETYDATRSHFLTRVLLPDGANALFVAVDGDGGGGGPEFAAALAAAVDRGRLEWVFDDRVGTALAHAARRGVVGAVEALLGAGANPGYVSAHGESLLGAAATGGCAACVRALARHLSARAANAVACTTHRTWASPLMAAVELLHDPPVVEALLAVGADPNLPCDGCPPAGRLLQHLASGLQAGPMQAARRLLRVLVANSRTDLDRPWEVLGGSLRAYAALHGLHV
jgi:hypothetical protein